MAKAPCRHFAVGKCRFGDKCHFSHEAAPNSIATDGGIAPPVDKAAEELKNWRFSIPKQRDRARSRPLGDDALAEFLEQTLQLLNSGFENMQLVITELATESGLIRVRETLARKYDVMTDATLAKVWKKLLLPYFKVLSHQTVLQSTVVEVRHATLLNELYGVSGQRGASVFKAVARHLTSDDNTEDVEVALAVLACMLEKNSSAKVNEELQVAAEEIVNLLDLTTLSRASTRSLRTVRTALQLGFEIPTMTSDVPSAKIGEVKPTFTVAQDMPGELSSDGPRHDNDFHDIRDIQILPTIEEVASSRLEYLPRENPAEWHVGGLAGLLDRQFRLIREDTVGQLRDAAKFQLERLQNPLAVSTPERQLARTYSYNNVLLENIIFDDQKGLVFAFSFDQPQLLTNLSTSQRQYWWEESRRLAPESLICLLSSAGDATFLSIAAPSRSPQKKDPLEKYSLAADPLRAFVVAQLTDSDPGQASGFLSRCSSSIQTQRSIIEFPGVVLPAFAPTLAALQQMTDTLDTPFADVLVPGQDEVDLPAPAYSLRPGFRFNLRSLLSDDDSDFRPPDDQDKISQTILNRSSLDDAQRKAVKHALETSLTLIQGPPGTGKSFTGVKLIQTLLDNTKNGKLGPIICVCYTNHALDQLLEHLVDAGVKQLIRIGSRSKSERLAAVNIRNVAQNYSFTKVEGRTWGKAKDSIKQTSDAIGKLLFRLNKLFSNGDEEVMAFLANHYPAIHDQISLCRQDEEEGWQVAGPRGRAKYQSPLHRWIEAGRLKHPSRDLPLAALKQGLIPLDEMSVRERNLLNDSWLNSIARDIHRSIEIQLTAFEDDKATIESLRGELDLRILSEASVIGITTTGLARNLQHLRKLTSKVLIVEEAGEVLEAHLLTAMLPSLEHAILIGDHQQLRPKVQNYELSVENPRSRIALDVSLFERLVHPRIPGSQALPFVTLETQRRMHPSISRLIREPLYPELKDADSVQQYPNVLGVRPRLFWLDHTKPEDSQNETIHATSHTNTFEVDMVAALVSHLQRQGFYAASDIAVLTPYLGQLRKLKRKLASSVEIILNDRDINDLAQDDSEVDSPTADTDVAVRRPSVTKGKLLQAVRLATVDNFQGEEAKVVVISLVRSNEQQKCGFLRTPNRINVLLSRAQHGMYIIGNSSTSIHIPMWQQVIQIFKAEGNIGPALDLACPRHPETPLRVQEPDDFVRVAPEAGCSLLCGKQLPCGHSCPQKCHAESIHNNVYCLKDCNRPRAGCEHPCELPCGAECATHCTVIVPCNITLPCGHIVATLPCWQFQDPSQILCEVEVERTIPDCGHTSTLACHISVHDPQFQCKERCSSALECGHTCEKRCHACRTRGEIEKIDHGKCYRPCGRDFNTCGHACTLTCHSGKDCLPCSAPCGASCIHSKCSKPCREPCIPCTEEKCPSSCPHAACQMPCGAPCDWVPCSQRCQKELDCGHRCPSMCGEPCPASKYCQVCANTDVLDIRVDVLTLESYGEVDLDKTPCLFLPCGHIFTVESLDGQMEMSTHYEMDETQDPSMPTAVKGDLLPLSYDKPKTCPDCRSSLRSISRYGRIVRRSLLDESTKRFIIWSQAAYKPLAERLKQHQDTLSDTVDEAVLIGDIVIINNHGLSKALKGHAGGRYKSILELRTAINAFTQKVRREEQPFQRVRDLVEAVRRRQESNIPEFQFDQTILQTRGQLLAFALSVRCELVLITDLVTVFEKLPKQLKDTVKLSLSLAQSRRDCLTLLETATKSHHILQQAESHIFWAQFAALEISVLAQSVDDSTQTIDALKKEGHDHLKQAQDLHRDFPGQTSAVANELDAVRKMLETSVSSVSAAEMSMIVAAMFTEFRGTGHWYRCANGHPFTIGECGGAMQLSRCPQCNAPVGGQHHQAAAGVTHARDLEQQLGQMRL